METFIEKFRNSYHLSENDTQTLLSYMEEIRFKKKEVIVHEGSKNGNLYLIKQGIWRAHYLKDGHYHLVCRCRRSCLFGMGICGKYCIAHHD